MSVRGVAGLAVAATAAAGAADSADDHCRSFRAPTVGTVLSACSLRRRCPTSLVAVTPSFAVLLVGRLILGVAIAGYWSLAFGAGVSTRPGRDHVVSTSLSMGVSVATIVAVPLASLGR